MDVRFISIGKEVKEKTHRKSCDCNLMHRVVDTLQHHQHAVERLLQLLRARPGVAEFEQILEQQLILGDSLYWLK